MHETSAVAGMVRDQQPWLIRWQIRRAVEAVPPLSLLKAADRNRLQPRKAEGEESHLARARTSIVLIARGATFRRAAACPAGDERPSPPIFVQHRLSTGRPRCAGIPSWHR